MASTVVIELDVSDIEKGIKVITSGFKDVQKEAGKTTTGIVKGFQAAQGSLVEMQRELRALAKETQTEEVRAKMAALANTIGTLKAQIRSAAADNIPLLINGLQGVVSVAQGVTASMSLFGVNTEKLNNAMIQLIGTSQALSSAYSVYEKRTIQNAASTAKSIAVDTAKAVSTKVLTAVTNGATAAQKAYNLALLASPVVLVAAAVAGLTYAFVKLSGVVDEARIGYEVWATRSRKLMEDLTESTDKYNKIVDDYNKKIGDYNDRNLSDGEKAQKQYLAQAEQQKLLLKGLMTQLQYKANLIQAEVEHAKAQYEWMRWLMPDAAKFMLKGITDLEARYKELDKVVRDNAERYVVWESNIQKNAETIRKNLDYVQQNSKKTEEGFNKEIVMLEKLIPLKQSYQEILIVDIDLLGKRNDQLNKIAQDEINLTKTTLQSRLQSEVEYRKTAEEKLAEQWKKGEIGWTEYYDKLNELETQRLLKSIELFNSMATQVLSIEDNIAEIENNNFQEQQKEQTAILEAEYEKRLRAAGNNALKKRRVEEWYTGESERLNERLLKQQDELNRKQKQREQVMAASKATMDYASGVIKIWAENSAKLITIPQAVALTALLTGVYATQLGVIKSQKFAQGGTGVLGGEYHSGGGVSFGPGLEAERDERWAIFSRSATRKNPMLPDLIDAINAERLVIDKDMMTHMLHNGGSRNTVLVANFKGGEHLSAMRRIMERQENKKNVPGRVKLGITNRKLLN